MATEVLNGNGKGFAGGRLATTLMLLLAGIVLWPCQTRGDTETWREAACISNHRGQVLGVVFSPDGGSVISSDGQKMRLWNVADGKLIREFGGQSLGPPRHTARFFSNGRKIIADVRCGIATWDVSSGKLLRKFAGYRNSRGLLVSGHRGDVESIEISPDGRQALSGSADGTIRLWDPATGRETRRVLDDYGPRPKVLRHVWGVAFLPDGRHAISGEVEWYSVGKQLKGRLRFWDLAAGREIPRFKSDPGLIQSLALSPDGKKVLVGTKDGAVRLWDVAGGRKIASFKGHTNKVTCVAFSPDGSRAVSGGYDRTLRIWDVKSGRQIAQPAGHKFAIQAVAFSPDGRYIASGGMDKTLRLWVRGKPSQRTPERHLLLKYAPVLYLRNGDRFRPSRVGPYLETTKIGQQKTSEAIKNEKIRDDEDGKMDIKGLSPWQGATKYGNWYDERKEEYEAAHKDKTIYAVYGRVNEKETIRGNNYVTAQYWFFYVFDGKTFSRHEGDWEMIQIVWRAKDIKAILDGEGLDPRIITFSQHRSGKSYTWNPKRIEFEDPSRTHPVVYIAENSHASYPNAGKTSILPEWFDHRAKQQRFYPAKVNGLKAKGDSYELIVFPEEEDWAEYKGRWGEPKALSPRGPKFPDKDHKKHEGRWSDPAKWGYRLLPRQL